MLTAKRLLACCRTGEHRSGQRGRSGMVPKSPPHTGETATRDERSRGRRRMPSCKRQGQAAWRDAARGPARRSGAARDGYGSAPSLVVEEVLDGYGVEDLGPAAIGRPSAAKNGPKSRPDSPTRCAASREQRKYGRRPRLDSFMAATMPSGWPGLAFCRLEGTGRPFAGACHRLRSCSWLRPATGSRPREIARKRRRRRRTPISVTRRSRLGLLC